MSNPVEEAAKVPGAVIGWAKARPFVFGLLILVVALLAIKFSDKITGFLRRWKITRWMVPAAAAAASVAFFFFATFGG